MQQDPNPQVRMMQVILVIDFILAIIFMFINWYMVAFFSIIFIVYNHMINRFKAKDGYNEERKQMGII